MRCVEQALKTKCKVECTWFDMFQDEIRDLCKGSEIENVHDQLEEIMGSKRHDIPIDEFGTPKQVRGLTSTQIACIEDLESLFAQAIVKIENESAIFEQCHSVFTIETEFSGKTGKIVFVDI